MEKIPQEIEFDKAKKYGGDTRSRMRTFYAKIKEAANIGDLGECKRLLELLKLEASKLPGIYARMQRAVDAYMVLVDGGMSAPAATAVVFPNSIEDLDKVKDVSTDGAQMTEVRDSSGQVWYKRTVSDAGAGGLRHLKSEVAVDKVYLTLGLGAPVSKMYGDVKLTQNIGGTPLVEYLQNSSVSSTDKDRAINKFIDGLDVDCMLSNWSAVSGNSGLNKFCVFKDGNVYRTGSYGAMGFKVAGLEKPSSSWDGGLQSFFDIPKHSNQQKILSGRKVSVLDLMRRTLDRDWVSAIKGMDFDDKNVILTRLERIRRIVEYMDELKKDPDYNGEDFDELIKKFIDRGFEKFPKMVKIGKFVPKITLKERIENLKKTGKVVPPTIQNLEDKIKNDIPKKIDKYTLKALEKFNNVSNAMQTANLGMRVWGRNLESIVDTWFKNLHETGTGSGSTNKESRRNFSEKAFGTPPGTPNVDMEKYGFAYSGQNNNDASGYGNWVFQFSRDKLENAGVVVTFTVGDSLETGGVPSIIDDPQITSLTNFVTKRDLEDIKSVEISSIVQETGCHYVELQYHGKLTINEVDAVYGNRTSLPELTPKVLAKFKELGIKVMIKDSKNGEYKEYKY